MARRKREADQFFDFLVGMPSWVGPLFAVAVFIGMRFILPAIFESRISGEPSDRGIALFHSMLARFSFQFAPIGFGVIAAIWAMAELKKFINRKRFDKQTGLDSIRDLNWREFESLLAEFYRRDGFEVEHTGSSSGDGGVDLRLLRTGERVLVQCKQWKAWKVGVRVVRELLGVVASAGASRGIIVTGGSFTDEARQFAESNPVDLIDGPALAQLIASVQAIGQREPQSTDLKSPSSAAQHGTSRVTAPVCSQCGAAMVERMARRGSNAGSRFWGCTKYPECRGIRSTAAR